MVVNPVQLATDMAGDAHLRRLADSLPVLIWLSDAEGNCVYVNQRFLTFTGLPPSELLGDRWLRAVHPLDVEPALQAIRSAIARQSPFQVTYRLRRADGEYRWLLVQARPQFTDDGCLAGYIGSFTDVTETKLAQERLQLFSEAVEQSAASVVITDLDGSIQYVNPKFTEVTGYLAEEVIGKNPRILKSGLTPEKTYRELWDTIRFGGHWKGEFRNKKKNGEFFWEAASISAVRAANGTISNYLGVKEDITERKRTEEALRKSEESYRGIVETAEEGILEIDADATVVFANRKIAEMLGYSLEEMQGASVYQFMDEEGRAAARANLARRRQGVREQFDFRYRRKDGSEMWGLVCACPLYDEEKRYAGALTMITDVSERKKAELLLDRFFTLSNALFAIVGFDGCFKRANPAVEAFLGLSSEQLRQRTFFDFVSPRDRERLQAEFERLLSTGQTSGFEARFVCGDGVERCLALNGVAVPEEQTIYAGGADITEGKRLEEVAALQARKLAESNLELERFAYVASHDLQEPLRMVVSFTQLLEKRYASQLDATARRYIAYATDGARRMQLLISGLLAYSRVDRGQFRPAPIDCEDVLRQVLLNLQASIEESGAMVTHDPLPTLTADSTQLTQLLQNLLGNAIKFRKGPKPWVHIGVEETATEWIVFVQDDGIGFDPDNAERIFQVFQRLHSAREYPGGGIGLAICKRIVERHGGRIWVESAPGAGARFRFALPKIQPENQLS